jgi:TPR repeat protein
MNKYQYLTDISNTYSEINLNSYIKKNNIDVNEIIDIFNGNIDEYVLKYNNCSPIQLIFALYYQFECINYELMKIHYLYCIENDNDTAMNNLGYYYQTIEKDYEKALMYYKMAILLKNSSAMNNLAYYYEKKLNNYEKAIEYYKMSIGAGSLDAINNLASLYYYQGNILLAIKYFDLSNNNNENKRIINILEKLK